MISYLLLLSFIHHVFSYNPSCYSCKFYIPHINNPDLGLCKIFRDNVNLNNKDVLVNNLAVHCRNNENLCGKAGFLYQSNDIDDKVKDDYEVLKNKCCGEVNETEEIEELEREFFEIFQKIKNHNKKRVYKTTKDLYKLFKRDNK